MELFNVKPRCLRRVSWTCLTLSPVISGEVLARTDIPGGLVVMVVGGAGGWGGWGGGGERGLYLTLH